MYDVHTHFVPPLVLDWLRDHRTRVNATWEKRDPNKEDFLSVNGKWAFELKKLFVNPDQYLEGQAQAGVQLSLISPIPQLFAYDFQPEITAEVAKVYNHALAKWVKDHPNRLAGLATLPLNDPAAGAAVLRDAMDQGLLGAIIGPGLGEQMLSDEFFTPLWEEANHQEAVVFIHPLLNEDPRLKRRMMPNLIGVPWETTLCATDLVLSGILDRFPRVKILLAHGGGFLPYQLGRITQGYRMWKPVAAKLQAPPGEYLKRFWYDSVLWSPKALEFLVQTVGADRVVPGSDYPFDLSEWPPVMLDPQAPKTLLNL